MRRSCCCWLLASGGHWISPSGQSLGGIGFRGASPQAATRRPMSAAFTISSWLMSAEAFRPSLGLEMTNQPSQRSIAEQTSEEFSKNARPSIVPSLHARRRRRSPLVGQSVLPASSYHTIAGSSGPAVTTTDGTASARFAKLLNPIERSPMPTKATAPAIPAFFIIESSLAPTFKA